MTAKFLADSPRGEKPKRVPECVCFFFPARLCCFACCFRFFRHLFFGFLRLVYLRARQHKRIGGGMLCTRLRYAAAFRSTTVRNRRTFGDSVLLKNTNTPNPLSRTVFFLHYYFQYYYCYSLLPVLREQRVRNIFFSFLINVERFSFDLFRSKYLFF